MPETPVREKFLKVIYRSEGQVELESNDMTVFDLWALARYIELRGDEIYITTQTAQRMAEQAKAGQLVRATQMPRQAGKVTPLRQQ